MYEHSTIFSFAIEIDTLSRDSVEFARRDVAPRSATNFRRQTATNIVDANFDEIVQCLSI